MPRRLVLVLAALAVAVPPPAAAAEFKEVWAGSTAQEACATLHQLKLSGLTAPAADASAVDDFHARARAGYPGAPEGAEVVVRVGVAGGMTNSGVGGAESVVAWRMPGGAWQGSRIRGASGPPSYPPIPLPPMWPEPPGAPADDGRVIPAPDEAHQVFAGPLRRETAAGLDAALASPCLREEPARLPIDLPLRGGGVLRCEADSAGWIVDIHRGGAARRYSRPCRLVGPVGWIAGLMAEARLEDVTPTGDRTKLYAVDPDPTPERLQAYLAARLPGARLQAKGLSGEITAYRPAGACRGELVLRDGGGQARQVRDWTALDGFENWPDGATVRLHVGGPDPERLTFPTTLAALKAEGALFILWQLCNHPKDG